MELIRKWFPAPFLISLVWIIVTCYGWGVLLAEWGVEWPIALLFGFAWSWLSYEIIHALWEDAHVGRD